MWTSAVVTVWFPLAMASIPEAYLRFSDQGTSLGKSCLNRWLLAALLGITSSSLADSLLSSPRGTYFLLTAGRYSVSSRVNYLLVRGLVLRLAQEPVRYSERPAWVPPVEAGLQRLEVPSVPA